MQDQDHTPTPPEERKVRKTQLNLVVGINGTGKTTWIRDNVVCRGRKSLIVTPDSAEWRFLPLVNSPDEIRQLQGAARIIYEGKNTLQLIQDHFYGGALILDDAMAYLNEQTPRTMQYIYIRRRQFGIDLYIVAHGLRQLPPKCFTFGSFLIQFATTENFSARKKELEEETFNRILEAQRTLKKACEQGENYKFIITKLDPTIQ